MARLMCFDYGKRRTGIAVSDPLQIIASPLDTIETKKLNIVNKKKLKNLF